MKRLSLILPILAALAIGACCRAPEDPDTLEVALVNLLLFVSATCISNKADPVNNWRGRPKILYFRRY